MKYLMILISFAFLNGCETAVPYYEVGAGYSMESGVYHSRRGAPQDTSIFFTEIDERCAIGHIALGVELDYGVLVEVNHNSCFNRSPEISNNHFLIKKRGYFK